MKFIGLDIRMWKGERTMRLFLVFIMVIHGLLHLLGFIKAFSLGKVVQLTRDISKPVGILWLLAAILFIGAAILFLLKVQQWWIPAAPAVFLSQALIVFSWGDARFGTLLNVIILLPLIVAVVNVLPSSFQNRYGIEVRKELALSADTAPVTEADLRHLPEPVQNYLRYVGVVGQPRVQNLRAVSSGAMKMKLNGRWLGIRARQYNFFNVPARIYYISSSMFGLPFDGLHLYTGFRASMQIKVAHLLRVVNARGDIMNKSETVTLFNDMCVLAPATLIDKNIQWNTIDPRTVDATFTNQGNTINAILSFNDKNELVNFVSGDRSLSLDGKTFKSFPWSTPVRDYREYDVVKVASYGEAIWHMPEGEFTYAKFSLEELEYNRKDFK
jgi:hypothetical protein